MKIYLPLAFFLIFFMIHKVRTGAIKAPLSIITLEDISEDERKYLDVYNAQFERFKRSGSSSPDLLSSLKTLLAQGAKAKLKLIGRASAAASSSLAGSSSSSSSGKSYPSHGYSYHPYPAVDENDSREENITERLQDSKIERIDRGYKEEKPDPWWMKKAVLNTLLQAVKAIKGGVLALKGQLIKGGGYLLVGGGKLVKAKGEVITNLGKKIARTAFRDMHSSEVHEDGSYGHYHPTEIEYGPPSGPGPAFNDHFHHVDYHESYPDKKAHAVQSGILILKRVPSGKNSHNSHNHYGAESTIKEAVEPNFGSIVGKLLSAASSSNPDSPAPFTDYRQTHPQPDDYASDGPGPSDDSDQHDQGNLDTDFELEPAFDSPEANKVIEPESSGEVGLGFQTYKTSENIPGDVPQHSNPSTIQQNPAKIPAGNFNGVLQGSDYGSSINVDQDFEQLNPPTKNDELNHFPNLNPAPVNFADLQKYQDSFPNLVSNPSSNLPSVGGNFAEPPVNYLNEAFKLPNNFNNYQNFAQEPSKPNSPNIFDHNFAEPPSNLLQYNLEASQGGDNGDSFANFGLLGQRLPHVDKNDFTSNTQFLGPYNPEYLKNMSQKQRRPPPTKKSYDKYRGQVSTPPKINQNLVDPSSNLDLPRFSPNHHNFLKPNSNHSNFPPFPRKPSGSPNRPPFSQFPPINHRKKPPTFNKPVQGTNQQFFNSPPFTRSKNQPRPPNFDIVQSVTYQLGPNGPTKI